MNTTFDRVDDGAGAIVSEIEMIDRAAVASVACAATTGGWMVMPMAYCGASNGCSATFYTSGGQHFMKNDLGHGTFELLGLPHGHTLANVRVTLAPDVGHVAEPDNLPEVYIYRLAEDGTGGTLDTQTYTWGAGDPANYDAGFTLTSAALGEVIDLDSYRYFVVVSTESGANSRSGCQICSIEANVTISTSTDFSFWV